MLRKLGATTLLAISITTSGCGPIDVGGTDIEQLDEAASTHPLNFHVWFLGPNSEWDNSLYGTMQTLQWCKTDGGNPALVQELIDKVPPDQKIVIYMMETWQSCRAHRWIGFGEFKSKMPAAALDILNANKDRIEGIYVYDEPTVNEDVSHGDIQKAINYLKKNAPKIPRFVNHFSGGDNRDFYNVSWASTTKGASPYTLKGIGKPMNLFAFNNEGDELGGKLIQSRWNSFLNYHYSNQRPFIKSFSWWTMGLEPHHVPYPTSGTWFLKSMGATERVYHESQRAPFAMLANGNWFAFFRNPDGTFSYRSQSNARRNDAFLPLPIGGASSYQLSTDTQGNRMQLAVTGLDGQVYLGGLAEDGAWEAWAPIPGFSSAASRPILKQYKGVLWVGVRDTAGDFWLTKNTSGVWKNVGNLSSLPIFKVQKRSVRIAALLPGGNVKKISAESAFNGSTYFASERTEDDLNSELVEDAFDSELSEEDL